MTEYIKAKLESEAAYQQYSYAGQKLENARIRERLAMLGSQHAPLSNLRGANRAEAYAVAFYCVIGRWPDEFSYMGV